MARLLSPHDVGVAATLSVTLSLADLLADMSVDKLLIQADSGDESRLRATAQFFSVGRGVVQALGLFLLSWPVARLFQTPEAMWAFQFAALVPLIRGFAHLDVYCAQRDLRFAPAIISEILPQTVSLSIIWPLARSLGDYRAVLFAAMLQAVLYVACTHLTTRRTYAWALDPAHLRRIRAFGWPLVINGALLFAINQGDRIAVGAAYSKEQLAVWSNALLLASAPLMLVGKVATSIALPILSRSRSHRAMFDDRYAAYMQGLAMVAALATTPMLMAGGPMMRFAFGPAYEQAGTFVGLLALSQAIRVVRVGPTMASLAFGQTTNPAIANIGRMLGVALAVGMASRGAAMTSIAAAAIVGEVAALGIAVARLSARSPITPMQSLWAVIPLSGCFVCSAALAGSRYLPRDAGPLAAVTAFALLSIIMVLLFCYPRLRREPRLFLAWIRGKSQRGVAHPGSAA